MAHEHKLEIFRGLLKFKSNERKIWGVFTVLSIVTIVEVALGIIKPGANVLLLPPLNERLPFGRAITSRVMFNAEAETALPT